MKNEFNYCFIIYSNVEILYWKTLLTIQGAYFDAFFFVFVSGTCLNYIRVTSVDLFQVITFFFRQVSRLLIVAKWLKRTFCWRFHRYQIFARFLQNKRLRFWLVTRACNNAFLDRVVVHKTIIARCLASAAQIK